METLTAGSPGHDEGNGSSSKSEIGQCLAPFLGGVEELGRVRWSGQSQVGLGFDL